MEPAVVSIAITSIRMMIVVAMVDVPSVVAAVRLSINQSINRSIDQSLGLYFTYSMSRIVVAKTSLIVAIV